MEVGVIYNTFLCFLTGIISLIAFLRLRKERKEKGKEYSEFLDYFILSLGVLWIAISVSFTEHLFKWLSGPLVYIHLLPAFYYLSWSFFRGKERVRQVFNGVFTLMVILALVTFFAYGFTSEGSTYWGSQYRINDLTNNIFVFGIFVPAVLLIILDVGLRIERWRKKGNGMQKELLLFDLGFLVYAASGVLDGLGLLENWIILLSRIGTMAAPLIFYLAISWDFEE
ncbi:MAG: hypothetical protein GF370_02180 [Candidatus Nealsonbacteria bacterium]|nr:hypothetical protein [Candidatus Nealsonbacteria bacterium]